MFIFFCCEFFLFLWRRDPRNIEEQYNDGFVAASSFVLCRYSKSDLRNASHVIPEVSIIEAKAVKKRLYISVDFFFIFVSCIIPVINTPNIVGELSNARAQNGIVLTLVSTPLSRLFFFFSCVPQGRWLIQRPKRFFFSFEPFYFIFQFFISPFFHICIYDFISSFYFFFPTLKSFHH